MADRDYVPVMMTLVSPGSGCPFPREIEAPDRRRRCPIGGPIPTRLPGLLPTPR